ELKPRGANQTPGEFYRCWLFGEGLETEASPDTPKRQGVDREAARKVLNQGGKLRRSELLRCRVRYFSDGVAIGSKGFVEGVFQAGRDHFGAKRKDGARLLKEAENLGIYSLRALRIQAVE
ncbi:MAG: chemotaxis protein CheW, partial [Verrucomicrobiota bacterium JB025]|nr:chemotaxis protein CheW [Verrucomicrobiota bacterium JB025]